MNSEIIKKICKQCRQDKILILDFLVADRNREDIICKSCRNSMRKNLPNYMPKHLRGQIGVKL